MRASGIARLAMYDVRVPLSANSPKSAVQEGKFDATNSSKLNSYRGILSVGLWQSMWDFGYVHPP